MAGKVQMLQCSVKNIWGNRSGLIPSFGLCFIYIFFSCFLYKSYKGIRKNELIKKLVEMDNGKVIR